jgi:hypothetical protein
LDQLSPAARLISNVGFPIFVSLVLLYQVFTMHRESHNLCKGLRDEIARLRAAVEGLRDLLLRSSELKLTIRD